MCELSKYDGNLDADRCVLVIDRVDEGGMDRGVDFLWKTLHKLDELCQ